MSTKTARKRITRAQIAEQEHAVATALPEQSTMPDFLRAAYAYERNARPLHTGSLSFLRRGDVFKLMGSRQVVLGVNECRATVVPLGSRSVRALTAEDGSLTFSLAGEGISVCPNSAVEILEHLSAEALRERFSGATTDPQTERNENMIADTEGVVMATPEQMGKGAEQTTPKQQKRATSQPKRKEGASGEQSKSAPVSMAGRSAYIKKLVADGKKSFEDVYAAVNKKYPTSSQANVRKVWAKCTHLKAA